MRNSQNIQQSYYLYRVSSDNHFITSSCRIDKSTRSLGGEHMSASIFQYTSPLLIYRSSRILDLSHIHVHLTTLQLALLSIIPRNNELTFILSMSKKVASFPYIILCASIYHDRNAVTITYQTIALYSLYHPVSPGNS